ncbi:MAG: class I SAM-dependent methyltransferase [Patescibacteria group bacterium]|nr:class I SAM-dependent methyltransferase [Patescibacteria group bacterium]
MLNKFLLKIGLTSKITRGRMEGFIKKHQDYGLTLDLGCGYAVYQKYFPNCIGFDIQPGLKVDVVGDAHNLPFKNEEFDNILCTEVLEHLHSPEIAISEMERVLKRGGKLILTTRFIFPLHDVPNDYYRFTKYGLKHLFKEWKILELKEETDTIGSIAVLLQRIGYQCEILHFRPFKLFFFVLSKLILPFSFIITKEFGDISKKHPEQKIITSGYYLICQKK